MLDQKFFEDIARRLCDAIPKPIRDLEKDLQNKFKAVLQNAFAKLDLVSREEFDAQTKVLLRTREKLTILEAQVKAIEQQFASKPKTKPKPKKE